MDTFAAAMIRRRSSSATTTLGTFSHKRSDSVSSITPATTPEAKAAEGSSYMDPKHLGLKSQGKAVVSDSKNATRDEHFSARTIYEDIGHWA